MVQKIKNTLIFTVVLALSVLCFYLVIYQQNFKPTVWIIENTNQKPEEISWAPFLWTNEILGDNYYEKTSIMVPCRLVGIDHVVTFQLDLGCDVSGVYENTFEVLALREDALKNKIITSRNKIRFWIKRKVFDCLELRFGDYVARRKNAYIFENHGTKVKFLYPNDTITLGTIGSDMFKDKVLIIDYPKMQFALCSSIPSEYNDNLVDIEIDEYGRVILPMKLKGKDFRIAFDTGSSIFPLIASEKNISNFTTCSNQDTIVISSWGEKHAVTGKIIQDTFELAGQKYHNVSIYANHSGLGINNEADAMTGNALFWDKTITIDFKNKKLGIK